MATLESRVVSLEKRREGVLEIPKLSDVVKYAVKMNFEVDPCDFFEYYDDRDWVKVNGWPVRNWKGTLRLSSLPPRTAFC